MSIWDDPSIRPSSGNYAKFEIEGDNVDGARILAIGSHTWEAEGDPSSEDYKPANTVPKLTLLLTKDSRLFSAGDTVTWTVNQKDAIAKLFDARPDVGDTLVRAAYAKKVRLAGGRSRKEFVIEVQRASEAPATPTADDLA